MNGTHVRHPLMLHEEQVSKALNSQMALEDSRAVRVLVGDRKDVFVSKPITAASLNYTLHSSFIYHPDPHSPSI